MTKSELISRLAEKNPHLYMRDIENIVETFFEQVTQAKRLKLVHGLNFVALAHFQSNTAKPALVAIHAQAKKSTSSQNASHSSKQEKLCANS